MIDAMMCKKQTRWEIDDATHLILESIFKVEKFPNADMRMRLGFDLNVSPRQVQVWFQNKRQRSTSQLGTTWLTDLLALDLSTTCRSCEMIMRADPSHFDRKQLKAFVKQRQSMICKDCASQRCAENEKWPVGVKLDWRTGVPERGMGLESILLNESHNSALAWPYERLRRSHCDALKPLGGGVSLFLPEPLFTSAWVTNPGAISTMGDGFRYYPNFLSPDEERRVLTILDADGMYLPTGHVLTYCKRACKDEPCARGSHSASVSASVSAASQQRLSMLQSPRGQV